MAMRPEQPTGFTGLPTIPAIDELRGHDQWVTWKWVEGKNGKLTKVPVSARTGFAASSTNPDHWATADRATQLAVQRKYPGIGFVLTAADDFVGIDLDDCIDEDGVLANWANDLIDLGETYAEVTPSGRGLRFFARGAEGVSTLKFKRADGAGVEVYTSERYLTVKGHRIGKQLEIGAAPKIIAALEAMAEEARAAKAAAQPATYGAPTTTAIVDREAPLSEVEELLFYVPAACGYDEWLTALMAVHAATGGSAEGEDLAIRWSATGGSQYDGPEDVRRKWRSFRREGIRINSLAEMARGYGADLVAITLAHRASEENTIDFSGLVIGPKSRGLAERESPQTQVIPPQDDAAVHDWESLAIEAADVTRDWQYPSGVLADITDWILATSRRPNRPLAVGAAIAIVATVAGRHIATPTGCGTHLYIACVGPTGVGKDRPQKAIARVLRAFGRPELAQTGKFMSGSAVERTVQETPCCCAIIDEMGQALFGRAGHRRASTHESAIFSALRELWSTSFEPFAMSRRAGDSMSQPTVYAPAMTIFGASTDQQFYDSLGAHVVEDGTLNRFTLIKAGKRSAPREYDLEAAQSVPQPIVDALQALLPRPPARVSEGVNFTAGMDVFMPTTEPVVRTVPWASEAVRERFKAFEEEILERGDRSPEVAKFIGRTSEMAVRLATIHALSALGPAAALRMVDLEWGIAIAERSAADMFEDVGDRLADNDYQVSYQLVKRILRGTAKGKWVTKRAVTIKVDGRLERRKLDEILLSLVDGGFVESRAAGSDGRARTVEFRIP